MGLWQRRLGAEEKVPCPGVDPERLMQQPSCSCMVSGPDPGKAPGWLVAVQSNLSGHSTCWSLEPLPVADQHSPLLFTVL